MSHTTTRCHAILTDAHVLAAGIDAALASLHDSLGGYPASTPGAAPATERTITDDGAPCREHDCHQLRPCPEHDVVTLTQPERDATTKDPAADDMRQLLEHIRKALHHVARAATITTRWANPATDTTTVAKRLAEIDRSIWCTNCARHGINNVSEPDRHECKFCRTFRITYGSPAPKGVLDIHGYRTVTPQDAVRILDRDLPGWRKTAPKPKTGRRKKEGEAA